MLALSKMKYVVVAVVVVVVVVVVGYIIIGCDWFSNKSFYAEFSSFSHKFIKF